MARFLVDEDLPRSLATTLRAGGTFAEDVRDVGLRGSADAAILTYAAAHGLTLLTGDLGFANPLRFSPGSHRGIVVARLPSHWAASTRVQIIAAAVPDLPDMVLLGGVAIIEPGRIRLRRLG